MMSATTQSSLVELLGATKARVVDLLRDRARTARDLATHLGISEAAVRRHLQSLERDELVEVDGRRGHEGPGRPSVTYQISDRARRLYPDRSADVANELLDYLEHEHGRSGVLAYLRWRQTQQAARYDAALGDVTGRRERARRLAELLAADGYLAEVAESERDGLPVLELRQGHCAIGEVAAAHPEICAHEAATFRRLLGGELGRRQTIAGGAASCVCTIPLDPASS